jgi:alpha-D-ribose 1-methylphosphonate 5-triphosphate synthase subunit PhnG
MRQPALLAVLARRVASVVLSNRQSDRLVALAQRQVLAEQSIQLSAPRRGLVQLQALVVRSTERLAPQVAQVLPLA